MHLTPFLVCSTQMLLIYHENTVSGGAVAQIIGFPIASAIFGQDVSESGWGR